MRYVTTSETIPSFDCSITNKINNLICVVEGSGILRFS